MAETTEAKRPKADDALAASSNPFASLVTTPVAAKRLPSDASTDSPVTAVKPSRDELAWRSLLSFPAPAPRESSAMAVLNGQVIAFGGTFKSVSGFPSATAELITLDPCLANPSWRQMQSSGEGPCARAGHAMCEFEGSIILCARACPCLASRRRRHPDSLAGTAV